VYGNFQFAILIKGPAVFEGLATLTFHFKMVKCKL